MEIKDLKSFKEIKPSEASKVIGGVAHGDVGTPPPPPLPIRYRPYKP